MHPHPLSDLFFPFKRPRLTASGRSTNRKLAKLLLLLFAGLLPVLPAQETASPQEQPEAAIVPVEDPTSLAPLSEPESPAAAIQFPAWFTGENVSFLDGVLTPSLHAVGAFGGSTADPEQMANGHHDPQQDATLQSLEAGLSLRAGQLQGFAVYSASTDADGVLDGALEEGFLKGVELPLGLEVRGGQFLNRFGFQNAVHNHGWFFVDQNLVNGRFLNEGELTTIGGEVAWNLPTPARVPSVLSVSYGGLPRHHHDHEHAHGEEEEEHHFEAEGANFDNWVTSAQWLTKYDVNDFHQFTGILSGAWGENAFARTSQVYGIGLEYLWRENGYEPGGRHLRLRNEVMLRRIDAVAEHHDDDEEATAGTFDEAGLSSMVGYGITSQLEALLRCDWVSGIREMELEDRWRISPAATWYFDSRRTSLLRLQYNYDFSDTFDEEHSVWAQLQLSWGGAEVR